MTTRSPLLTALALAALYPLTLSCAAESHLLLADFEQGPAIALTGEGVDPASEVALSREHAKQGHWAAQLDYTFQRRTEGLNYVGFHVEATLAGRPTVLRVWVYGDGSGQPLRLRLRDAGGETFQYHGPDISWSGWEQAQFDLGRPQVSWGGNQDGAWDLPLSLDSILIDSATEPYHGVVYFDEITYLSEAGAADWVQLRARTDVFGGVYFGEGRAVPPMLLTDNLCLDGTVSGRLVVTVFGPRGLPVYAQDVELELPPRAGQWLGVRLPAGTEGLCRLEAAFTVGGEAQTLSRSFAVFSNPHDPALMPDSFFGACTHFGQGKGNVPGSFDLMSRAGIKWLRDEISWGACEAEKGKIVIPDWADRYMEAAVSHGVTPLIILDYGNRHYEDGNAPASPQAQQAFGRYCYALVDHFKGICRHWEVYNEPNIGFWRPKPDPVAYARLLRIAYTEAKRADPDCTVVGVCTAGTDLAFIETVLQNGGVHFMDALSIHPYRYPRSPEDSGFVQEVTSAHELMVKYGGGDKPLWITEIGWPTQEDARGVSEPVSGDYLIRMMVLSRTLPFMERVIWYDFQDDGLDRTYNEHNFGLIRWETFAPKANYVAFKTLTEHLSGARYVGALLSGTDEDSRHCYEFAGPQGPVLVAWSAGGAGTLALTLDTEEVGLTWPDAHREKQKPVDGGLTLALDGSPVFITGGFTQVSIGEPCMAIEVEPRPVGPGERFAVKTRGPEGAAVKLTWDAAAPVKPRRGEPAAEPNTHWFAVERRAVAQDLALIATATDASGAQLASAGATVQVQEPLEATLAPPVSYDAAGMRLGLHLSSLRSSPLRDVRVSLGAEDGMEVQPAERRVDLPAGGSVELPLEVTFTPPGLIPGRRGVLQLRAKTLSGAETSAGFPLGGITIRRAQREPRIDGSGSDWPPMRPIELGKTPADFVTLGTDAWAGQEDLGAGLRLQWDDRALYLLASVTDDTHVQSQSGPEVWKGDGIQLAYDPRFEGWKAKSAGRPPSYAEIGLTKTSAGDEVYRWLWKEGPVVGVALRVGRQGNTTTYEASIPWEQLNCGPPVSGDIGGFSLLINEDDGNGREGWLQLYDGIGYGKDPSRFGILRFEG